MIEVVSSLALLVVAAVASWQNRPATKGNEWPGSAAGRFAAALMLFGLGVVDVLALLIGTDANDGLGRTQLLMSQLGLYAALPLLVSTHLAERLRQHWTRQTWGRIFLGWCVVFELGRRGDVLDSVALVTLIGGAVTLLLCWAPARLIPVSADQPGSSAASSYLPLLLWGAAILSYLYGDHQSLVLPLALSALVLAQPESYRMAQAKR